MARQRSRKTPRFSGIRRNQSPGWSSASAGEDEARNPFVQAPHRKTIHISFLSTAWRRRPPQRGHSAPLPAEGAPLLVIAPGQPGPDTPVRPR